MNKPTLDEKVERINRVLLGIPREASWKEILEKTDWKLLRDQKEILSEILTEYHKLGMRKKANEKVIKRFSAIEGLLSFLDHIQDAAANDIGDDEIFDYDEDNRCEYCKEPLKSYVICPDGTNLKEVNGCTNHDCDMFDVDAPHE